MAENGCDFEQIDPLIGPHSIKLIHNLEDKLKEAETKHSAQMNGLKWQLKIAIYCCGVFVLVIWMLLIMMIRMLGKCNSSLKSFIAESCVFGLVL